MSAYLQYGSGWSAPDGWLNFDASPTLWFERLPFIGHLYTKNENRFPTNTQYGDIVKGLSVPNNSFNGVYCSHVLEHLALDDFHIALKNTYNLLKPGGVFRFVLPDLEFYINKYVNSSDSSAAEDFMKDTSLGVKKRNRGIKGLFFLWLSNSSHLWMWDYKAIVPSLTSVGFAEVRRAYFGDAKDQKFNEVENEARWTNCLGVECVK